MGGLSQFPLFTMFTLTPAFHLHSIWLVNVHILATLWSKYTDFADLFGWLPWAWIVGIRLCLAADLPRQAERGPWVVSSTCLMGEPHLLSPACCVLLKCFHCKVSIRGSSAPHCWREGCVGRGAGAGGSSTFASSMTSMSVPSAAGWRGGLNPGLLRLYPRPWKLGHLQHCWYWEEDWERLGKSRGRVGWGGVGWMDPSPFSFTRAGTLFDGNSFLRQIQSSGSVLRGWL